jgi:multidrug efflux pump
VQEVEQRFLNMKELKTVYARTLGGASNQGDMPEDVIGVIQMEFVYWEDRRPAETIIAEIRDRTADIPGIMIQAREQESGPSGGKPVQISIGGRNAEKISETIDAVRQAMNGVGGFVDVEDSRPLPGIEWRILVDREKAARYGADITLLGDAIKMITSGIQLAEYRPDDADEELDIRLRFPVEERNLEKLRQLKVPTSKGQIPISNFIQIVPAQKTGTLRRTDGHRVMTIRADVEPGLLVDDQVTKVKGALADFTPDPSVRIGFKGQDADQREAGAFLANAFITAIFLMTIILVTQFNSFYQAGLVLSAIIFSTAGVLLGLLVTGQPFGVVMGGIGVIALAGIVVNNNIVLIDTYNDLRKRGLNATDAVMRTAAQRVRPVLLTSITTVLGLLPMVLAINIDLIGQDISFGAPSTQWWRQLSSAIAGGLTFATVLTLILTPCLLVLGDNIAKWYQQRRGHSH